MKRIKSVFIREIRVGKPSSTYQTFVEYAPSDKALSKGPYLCKQIDVSF